MLVARIFPAPFSWARLVVALLVPTASALAAEPLHPPYPAIWGREVPGYPVFITPSEAKDEVMVGYFSVTSGQKLDDASGYGLHGFFGGATRSLTKEALYAIDDARRRSATALGAAHPHNGRVVFADGSTLAWERMLPENDKGWTCEIAAPATVKRNAAGKVIWRKVMVRLLERPVTVKADQNCADGGQEYTAQVDFLSPAQEWDGPFYGFADGTFLVGFGGIGDNDENMLPHQPDAADRRYVIRFDGDLNSPFLATLPNVVIVDAKLLQPIVAEALKHHSPTAAASRSYFHAQVFAAMSKLAKR